MRFALSIIQLLSGLLLTLSILIQNRGTGLSAAFGGEGNIYRTKRGVEKVLFIGTIILAIFFFSSSLANIVIQR